MRCLCPHCFEVVAEDKSGSGINFCPYCQTLFKAIKKEMPPWILGVLVVVMANWQLGGRLHGSGSHSLQMSSNSVAKTGKLVPSKDMAQREERRSEAVNQLATFHDDSQTLPKEMSRPVLRQDMQTSGISFYHPGSPADDPCTIVLSPKSMLIYVKGKVIQHRPCLGPRQEWGIGCEFLGRVAKPLRTGTRLDKPTTIPIFSVGVRPPPSHRPPTLRWPSSPSHVEQRRAAISLAASGKSRR